tara:strand:- start:3 stop:266 length:264 start_codon:yes stop_codon:yes gene_type:complete
MPVSHKIISAKDQPNGGNGMISIAGARGLGSSGTLITELSSNNIFSPFPPYAASQLDLSTTVLDNKYSERFDDTNYYHGSGSYGGPS